MSTINGNFIQHPILQYPDRSPLNIAFVLKDIIKDKTVCDIGCACGDLLIEFSKFCKNVLGVERNKDHLYVARARGLVVNENEIPDADVYYVWANADGLEDIMQKMKNKKGILVLSEESRNPVLGGYEIEVPLLEHDENRKNFHLQIVELK